MPKLLLTLWNQPRAAGATGPQWYDWVLVLLILSLSGVEVALRDGIIWRELALLLNTLFACVLPWRRVKGAYLLALVFGLNSLVQLYALTHDVEWTGLYTTVLILVLPFALVRWASGKEVVAGWAVILLTFASTTLVERPPWGEIAGAILFILFPTMLGGFFRYESVLRQRTNERIRLLERERLARDLHDTVGHYMSAIAVQAQAGRALAASDAEAPDAALKVIEDASRNALAEMRSILRSMRADAPADYKPAGSLDDVKRMAESSTYPFEVKIKTSGDLSAIDGVTASTLYRLAQESITNSARHGREVNTLTISVSADGEGVLLSVRDDGVASGANFNPGLGLQGMRERVLLLGGEFGAGPAEEGGWSVRARLPMPGVVR
ncbi:MAG: sensor histidine kinase [Pseudomonadota bacterium]